MGLYGNPRWATSTVRATWTILSRLVSFPYLMCLSIIMITICASNSIKKSFSEDSRKLISSKHRVYVLFRSLSRHQHTGFHLEYKAICGGEIKLTKNQASKNQAYEIMSPNFPEEYPSNSNCSWIVTAPPGFVFRIM